MPAESEKQRRAALAALAAKRAGRTSQLKGAAKQMAEGMSEEQLQHFTHKKKGAK